MLEIICCGAVAISFRVTARFHLVLRGSAGRVGFRLALRPAGGTSSGSGTGGRFTIRASWRPAPGAGESGGVMGAWV